MNQSRSARILVGGVNVYQQLSTHRSSPCRYIPSCSEYAREALTAHGAIRGTWMALRRLGRCHPFGGYGFDPVPQSGAPRAHTQGGGNSC